MSDMVVNGVILNESISEHLRSLQDWEAKFLSELLDDAIGFRLGNSSFFEDDAKKFVGVLTTLHTARIQFLELIPDKRSEENKPKGGEK